MATQLELPSEVVEFLTRNGVGIPAPTDAGLLAAILAELRAIRRLHEQAARAQVHRRT